MRRKKEKALVVNMAFGQGSESVEGSSYNLYTGVAPFHLLAVNPGVEQLKEWFPTRDYTQKPPNYIYNKEGEAKGVFITFYLKANTEHKEMKAMVEADPNFNFITRYSILLKKELYYNKDKTKVQVINAYGDTGWPSIEELKDKTLPDYMIRNNYIMEGMRPAYVGEEDLIKFLKTYINIPNCKTYDKGTGTWTNKTGEDLKASLAGFSTQDLDKLIDGDMSPIRNAIKYQPKNQIKVLCGVRTTSDNKEFQDVLTRYPMKLGVTDYSRLDKELSALRDAGSYDNTNFGEYPFTFQKYKVTPTAFQSEKETEVPGTDDDPFAGF